MQIYSYIKNIDQDVIYTHLFIACKYSMLLTFYVVVTVVCLLLAVKTKT